MLFIFMFIYSLLGMELFAYRVKFDQNDKPVDFQEQNGTYPDSTFNTFIEAIISVFIVLANDGWSTVYITHYRATGWLKSTIFFVSLLIIGQFILLNLFLAILIRNFDE
jgi:voltage-dependent calcium channel L type alpha-1D